MKNVLWLLIGLILVNVNFAEAQQPKKLRRIAFLDGGFASSSKVNVTAFREGLRDLG